MPKSTPINKKLSQALIDAVSKNDEKKVRQLLARDDIDVNMHDGFGNASLHYAFHFGFEGCVKLLLARDDIDVNVQDDEGESALHRICLGNNDVLLSLLLSHPKIDVNIQNKKGISALHYLCIGFYHKMLNMLLAHPKLNVNIQSEVGQTPLHFLCAMNNPEKVELLLKMANINDSLRDNVAKTPLDVIKNEYQAVKEMGKEEPQERCLKIIDMLENFKPVGRELSPDNQEKLSNLSPNDIKMPENKAFLDECVREVGIPQLFVGLRYKQQSALLDVYAAEIRANDRYSNIIGQIVYATHKAEKEKRRQNALNCGQVGGRQR